MSGRYNVTAHLRAHVGQKNSSADMPQVDPESTRRNRIALEESGPMVLYYAATSSSRPSLAQVILASGVAFFGSVKGASVSHYDDAAPSFVRIKEV